jgi:hypothetical protein
MHRAAATIAALAIAACGRSGQGGTTAAPAPAEALHDEAGFVDVPAQPGGSPYAARMFYVFEPADDDAAHRPLVVFTAGGPGYPASLELLPYGTARATLASATTPGVPPQANAVSWTSFANVLFVDERQAGFSYEIAPPLTAAGDGATCTYAPVGDASDFVRVVLAFLDAHAALHAAPVVLVGQSYGGERVTLAENLLLHYADAASPVDGALRAAIQAHYDAVFPDRAGAPVAPAVAATQFGRLVLLQPFVLGGLQYATQDRVMPADPFVGNVPAGRDAYDVREPAGWSQAIDDVAAAALAQLSNAATLLAVDPRAIAGMRPAARAGAFRVPAPADAAQAQTNAAFAAALGALGPEDAYLASPATACPYGPDLFAGPGSLDAFVADLADGVRAFVSDARYDGSIYAPAIPAALAQIATVTVDTSPRPGVARPGWFRVALAADAGTANAPNEVRFPAYNDSGHFVALAQPGALHDDVAAWIAASP